MNQILIDTNAYAAFKQGDPDAVAVLQQAPRIGINAIVLGELYSGFRAGSRETENRQELDEFLAVPRVTVIRIDPQTARQYAVVYSLLRNAGTPIPTNDMWIAATALQHGFDLFSHDKHFEYIQGLRVGSSPRELA